jgi:hypothetical protein
MNGTGVYSAGVGRSGPTIERYVEKKNEIKIKNKKLPNMVTLDRSRVTKYSR